MNGWFTLADMGMTCAYDIKCAGSIQDTPQPSLSSAGLPAYIARKMGLADKLQCYK